jgi:HEAT repeat protein
LNKKDTFIIIFFIISLFLAGFSIYRAWFAPARSSSSENIEQWLELLTYKDSHSRSLAANKLGRMGKKKAVPYLIEALNKEKHKGVMISIIVALKKLRDERAVDILINMFDYPALNIQAAACEALGEIGDIRATEKLISYVDEKEGQAPQAITALGLIQDKRALYILTKYLWIDDMSIRTIIINAFRDIGDSSALPYLKELMRDPLKGLSIYNSSAPVLPEKEDPELKKHGFEGPESPQDEGTQKHHSDVLIELIREVIKEIKEKDR